MSLLCGGVNGCLKYNSYSYLINKGCPTLHDRVEAPISNHLRDYAPILEKYKVVQNFLV